MKKLLSLLMSYVMLFNLTMSAFAQNAGSLLGNNKITESQERLKKEKAKFDTYTNAIDNTIKYNQNAAEAKMQADQKYMNEVRKELVEASSSQDQKVAESLGADFNEFQDSLIAYAKENNIPLSELNIMESWQDHVKALNDYNNDYMVLSRKLDPLKFTTVLNNAQKMLAGNGTRIKYDDKEYDKVAFLHASIHNLVTRTKSGNMVNGTWVWSDKVAEDFTLEQRLSVMGLIYEVMSKEGYYPDDRPFIWAFAYKIVEEGQKAFEQPLQGTRFTEVYEKEKESQANSVALAMAILPDVSFSDTEKKQSADIIYTRVKETLSSQQAAVSLLTGAKALIAFKTKQATDYLITLLTKDCRNSYFKGSVGLLLDSFSVEEWSNRFSDAATRISQNYGRYNNSASGSFTYADAEKNGKASEGLLEADSKEAFATLVYTNVFEEIGREIGRNAAHSTISPVVNIIANNFVSSNQDKIEQNKKEEKSQQKKETEEPGLWTKIVGVAAGFVAAKIIVSKNTQTAIIDKVKDDVSASVVSGILETTKSKNASLTAAAELLYNGSWWDLNEPTQRSKNNIAAAYLGKAVKEYNEDKDKEFRTIYTAKKVSHVADIVVNIVMIGALVVAAPKIIGAVVSLPGKTIRGVKTVAGKFKNVKITAGKKLPVYSSNVRTTTVAATTGETAVGAATKTVPVSTAAPKVAQTVEVARTEAATTSLPKTAQATTEAAKKAQVIEQTKAQTQQALSQVEEALFGKQGKVAAMQVVPGLPMDFMRGDISFSQLLNRSPQIRSIYNAAVKSTMKAIETQGLTLEEAKAFFMKNFESRLNMSLLITDSRAASVVEKAGQAFGGSLDSAKATEAAAAAKPTNSALMQRGFDTRDIEEFNKLGLLEGENYSKVEALLEKGVDKMDIYRAGKGGTLEELYKNQVVVASRSSALTQMGLEARDIEYFTKAGLLEDANYSKVEALLKKGVDKMDIYRAGKNGTLGELYNSKVVANSSSGAAGTAAARGSAYSGGQASSFFEESAGTGNMPRKGVNNPAFKSGFDGSVGEADEMINRIANAPAAPAKALTIEEKEAALKALDKSVQSANGTYYYLRDPIKFTKLKMKGLLEDKYYSQVEKLIQNGMRNADIIISLRDAGLLESETFSKLEKLMDLGFKNTSAMARMKKNGFFEEPMFSRFEEIAKNTPTKDWDFISKGLISDANYPKTKALLEKYNIREIYDFSNNGVLDAKYAELAKSGANTANATKGAAKAEATGTTNAAQTAQTAKSASTATEMTKAEKMAYLEKKGITGWQIDAWERDIVNASGSKFERAKTLIDKGLDPLEVYNNRDFLLGDEGFAKIQDMLGKTLTPEDFNKLASQELFYTANGKFAMTEKLLQQGYKSDEIIALYKDMNYNIYNYSNNADKILAGRKKLISKGWTPEQAAILENKGFDVEKNYARMKYLMRKGMSNEEVYKLAEKGWLDRENFRQVVTFLDSKVNPEYFYKLRNEGYFDRYFSQTEYLLKKGVKIDDVFVYKEEGLLEKFEQTQKWMNKGFSFDEMKKLNRITLDYTTTDIAAQVDLLVEKGFTPTQIEQLWRGGKLNNNLNRIQTLLDRGADYNALMEYLN